MKNLDYDLTVAVGCKINIKVEDTCIPGMSILKLTNDTPNEFTTTPVDAVFRAMRHAPGQVISMGLPSGKPLVTVIDVDRFTKVEIVGIMRDGVGSALCKVYVRGVLYVNAMYRGDGKHRIVIDRFRDAEPKEAAQWRKPNSRLQSALSASSK